MAAEPQARRESRTPGLVNTVLAVLVLAVIVPLALIASQQPPPAIAEFAPQDQQQIKKAPNSQTGDQGQGQGDLLGQALPTPPTAAGIAPVTPSASPVDVARVRRCVGNPPRQTEDPQSPPCVPYFQGNHGGATYSHGVTGTTINIAFTIYSDSIMDNAIDTLVAYFNRRFEFYGRQIKAIHNAWQGNLLTNSSTQEQVNDATSVDQQAHAFMATSRGSTAFGDDSAFRDGLARRGVMSTNGNARFVTEAGMSAGQPYEWSVFPGLDRQERYLSDLICGTLAGHAPRLAPAQSSLTYPNGPPTRRWSLFSNKPPTGGNPPDVSIVHNAMTACSSEPLVEDVFPNFNEDQASPMDNALTKIGQDDVSTVVCVCDPYTYANFTKEADKQRRHPEWVISTSFDVDQDVFVQSPVAQDQAVNTIGVSWFNQPIPSAETFWLQAMHEVDPTTNEGSGYYPLFAGLYRDLLLVASGIQMAGPGLTPGSFQRGLYAARYSNPGNGGPPYYEATVGFGPGQHSQYQDARLIWWNPGGRSFTSPNAPGAYCAVNNGVRYFLGGLPKDDLGFKSGTC